MSHWKCGVGLVLGGLLATTACAADPAPATPPGVHRMVIQNGLNFEVRYFATGPLSPGDSATLRELERAENMAYYADSLQTLKQRYVNTDLQLEPERRYVQKALYGNNVTDTSSSYLNYFATTGGGGFGFPYLMPYNMGFGMGGYGGSGGFTPGGFTDKLNRSLVFGVGDEGRLKGAMAPVIAKDASSPDFSTAAYRSYDNAVARAAANPRLQAALRLPKPATGVAVGAEKPLYPITLTLKNGAQVHGDTMKEEGDFYVVESKYATERIRKSEVTRILRAKSGAKPIDE